MDVLILVDFSFLHYKYKYILESGRIRRLSSQVEIDGEVKTIDTSSMYYPLKEIEEFRKDWVNRGHNVAMAICFDMPSSRKGEGTEEAAKYKSNRVNKLSDEDFASIQECEGILSDAGYNTYRFDTYEADDIITNLIKLYNNDFDAFVIYTPDADLIVNVSNKVGVMRYKTSKGYAFITTNNFEEYLSAELKCNIVYNSLTLYKCTVGDKSDCIDGIKGFGPAAFNKMMAKIETLDVCDSTEWWKPEITKQILDKLRDCGYLSEVQYTQATNSLNLIIPKVMTTEQLTKPGFNDSAETRRIAYSKYSMLSLAK